MKGGQKTVDVLANPHNIRNYAEALAEGLSYGDRIHLRVVGGHETEEVYFVRFNHNGFGFDVAFRSVRGLRIHFSWGDIVELWLLDEKPNIYYSDVPEVAEKLKQLKSAVQQCVGSNDGAGVLFLLDQIIEIKKAEMLFKEAREIVASAQF